MHAVSDLMSSSRCVLLFGCVIVVIVVDCRLEVLLACVVRLCVVCIDVVALLADAPRSVTHRPVLMFVFGVVWWPMLIMWPFCVMS